MQSLPRVLPVLLLLFLIAFVACRDDENNQNPGGGGNNGGAVPQGMTRLYGTALDSLGQPVAGVALHVFYPAAGEPGSPVLLGSDVLFFDTAQVLTTECNGTVPLQDGITVKIYWDANDNNLADPSDPQPTPCTDFPNCPPGSVNYNEFPINGGANGLPGMFIVENDFNVIGEALSPNRFYLRIFCTDGNVLWTSEMVNVPEGPSEYAFHEFVCTTCSGIPQVPEWRLDPAYPNPTVDTSKVIFGLEQSARAVITLRQESNGRTDTVMNQVLPSGIHQTNILVSDRANGLYDYHYTAGSFAQTKTLLKNQSDHSVLRVTPEIGLTDGDGNYRFETAAGVTVDRRGSGNENLGAVMLDQVRLIAIKAGYQDLDTTFAIASAESLRVDLVLRP